MNTCNQCSVAFLPKSGSTGKFCSKSCSAKFSNARRNHSKETKQKISDTLKGRPGRNWKNWCDVYLGACIICDGPFYRPTYQKRKTCGQKECLAKASINRTSKIGSTNSIYWDHPTQGRIRFDSSWEETIAKYLDSQNILWERPLNGIPWTDLNNKEHFYFPDFFLPERNIYLDPKNDKVIKKDREKLDAVQKQILLYYGTPEHLIGILAAQIDLPN